jgi:hypothetical protein
MRSKVKQPEGCNKAIRGVGFAKRDAQRTTIEKLYKEYYDEGRRKA